MIQIVSNLFKKLDIKEQG